MRVYIVLLLFTFSCSTRQDTNIEPVEVVQNKYATGFTLEISSDGIKRVRISDDVFYLIPRDEPVPDSIPENRVIKVPVKRMVCTSTSHIPLLDYLDMESALVGFPTPDYISSKSVRDRIDAGMVTDVGIDQSVNTEEIITLEPDLVMGYSLGTNNSLERINSIGIPVLLNNEYLERHPLGRAEWIRVAGWLFQKEALADSIFSTIEARYASLKDMASRIENKPSVFSGVMYGDTWFLPGGNNNMSRLFMDAGLNYLWAEDESNGFLELSFETVLDKAVNADLWIGVANFNSLGELASRDERYSLFRAFQQGNVFTYDARKGPTGGSEYLELGYLRPDLILSDLITIGHPGFASPDTLFFHAKLQE